MNIIEYVVRYEMTPKQKRNGIFDIYLILKRSDANEIATVFGRSFRSVVGLFVRWFKENGFKSNICGADRSRIHQNHHENWKKQKKNQL